MNDLTSIKGEAPLEVLKGIIPEGSYVSCLAETTRTGMGGYVRVFIARRSPLYIQEVTELVRMATSMKLVSYQERNWIRVKGSGLNRSLEITEKLQQALGYAKPFILSII